MNDHILNLINQLLCYSDPSVTDNPHERAFDHRRRLEAIACKNPSGDSKTLAPGEVFTIVQNTVSTGLLISSMVQITQVSAQDSVYRLEVASGPYAFRTPRAAAGLGQCTVTVNNQSVAVFDFTGATLPIVVGDIMKINGDNTYDTGPFQFNPINSGIWKVIGVNGTKVSCVRQVGEPFEAVAETVASVGSDVQFFADDTIRPGMQFQINGTFSQVSQRTYTVLNSTPTAIDFVSTAAIPEETGLMYVPGSIVFYTGVKRMIYCEVDQVCSIRFNGQTDDLNVLQPIEAGNPMLRGVHQKWGDAYACQVKNLSVNSCTIKFFTVE
jgi:hypothetical protein